MVRAIVNADDFGISENVNDAIRLCFDKRIISNTTLMVNMPYALEAVKIAKESGFEERVGLHLNLTAGTPLTSPIRGMHRFCDGRGEFHADFHRHTSTRLSLTKEESRAVSEEIEAQIRRYLTFGLPEKHLDSHHHVHTDFSIWKELAPLLKKYDFRSVRLSRNVFYNGKCSIPNKIYKKCYNGKVKKSGMMTTDYFGSFKDFEAQYSRLDDNSLVEIMLHPMFSEDGELLDTKRVMSEIKDFVNSNHILIQAY